MKPFLHTAALILLAWLASVGTTAIDRARTETYWSGNMHFTCPDTTRVTQSESRRWKQHWEYVKK